MCIPKMMQSSTEPIHRPKMLNMTNIVIATYVFCTIPCQPLDYPPKGSTILNFTFVFFLLYNVLLLVHIYMHKYIIQSRLFWMFIKMHHIFLICECLFHSSLCIQISFVLFYTGIVYCDFSVIAHLVNMIGFIYPLSYRRTFRLFSLFGIMEIATVNIFLHISWCNELKSEDMYINVELLNQDMQMFRFMR